MAIAVKCGACGQVFRVRDEDAGTKSACPACGQEVVAQGEHAPDHDVFISYAHEDRPVADAVCAALEGRQVRCWVAPRDVPPGATFGAAILDAISDSEVMILIFSEHANRSNQVLREVSCAVENDRSIVPFRIANSAMSKDLKYFLGPVHWLDAYTPALEHHIQTLVGRVKTMLHEQTEPVPPATPKPVLKVRQAKREPAADTRRVETAREESDRETTLALPGGVRMEFVKIPAGKFMMGTPESEVERSTAEEPQHQVRIAAGFWLAKYQVTQAQWQAVMGNNPSHFKGDDRLPVEQVSWDECQDFIRRLNASGEGGFRLPSEAEWEYACRAGTTTPFSFGETISTQQANYDGNYVYGTGSRGEYRRKTTAVGTFSPNAWGLYDMHGNVWEWCQDWYHGSYDGAPTDGNAWESPAGQYRVVRGGSWLSSPQRCRSANRSHGTPDYRGRSLGFRVVRTLYRYVL